MAPWPVWREDALAREEVLIVIQVNGKLRGRMTAPTDADEGTLRAAAMADEQVGKFIADKPVKKVVVVKNKLVNIVV